MDRDELALGKADRLWVHSDVKDNCRARLSGLSCVHSSGSVDTQRGHAQLTEKSGITGMERPSFTASHNREGNS